LTCVFPLLAEESEAGNKYKVWAVERPAVQQLTSYRQSLRVGTIDDHEAFDQVIYWKISEWTRDEKLFEVPKLRRQLRSDLSIAGKAETATTHDRINQLAFSLLPDIVNDRGYHPGTRYNALLMIGDLNAVEGRAFNPTIAPQPWPRALPLLVTWLETQDDRNPRQDIIKLGALIGVDRHARYGIVDEDLRQRALRSAAQLAGQSRGPAFRSAEGHDWLRRRAIRLLAWIVKPGASTDDDKASELVFKALDDPSGSLKLQVDAAVVWSMLAAKKSPDHVERGQTLTKLAHLTARVIDSELASAANSPPTFKRGQSRRVVAAQMWMLTLACRQLGVDVASLRRSPAPTELKSFDDLYCGLKTWIGLATDTRTSSRKASVALVEAVRLLEGRSAVVAKQP
jgi:hypothetical protein